MLGGASTKLRPHKIRDFVLAWGFSCVAQRIYEDILNQGVNTDTRIRQVFTEVWKLYQEYYEIHPKDSDRWEQLTSKAAEIYDRYKDHTVVMNFLSVILEDIDSRSI